MQYSAAFKHCLATLDVATARRLWLESRPGFTQPKSDHEMLVILHHARTQSSVIAVKLRYYSHRWLLDHDLPSGLPDDLKPRAERMYPRVVEGVGISLNTRNEFLKPIVPLVRAAMSDAVLEAYADGNKDPTYVRERMDEARTKEYRKLIG